MAATILLFRYEELSKKYSALLQAYHESCNSASGREAALSRLHAHTRRALAQLTHAHEALLTVGDKYMRLWRKKQMQVRSFMSVRLK